MKKLGSLILAGMVLMALGLSSCVSDPYGKLELSDEIFTQPLAVGMISFTQVQTDTGVLFSRKYPKDADGMLNDDIVLKALCGTVAGNLELIEALFKAETGFDIHLNGDDFLQDLENGDTTYIVKQRDTFASYDRHFYQWRAAKHENPDVIIQLLDHNGTLIPFRVTIDDHDAMGNTKKQARIQFVNEYSDTEKSKLAAQVKQVTIR
jgi:hypothetical protein